MRASLVAVLSMGALSLPAINTVATAATESQQVNLYSHRHYEADRELYRRFEQQTGIKVNVIEGSADELIERLRREGAESPADLLLTVDAGRLVRAKEIGLLQSSSSLLLDERIPPGLRDPEGHWYGLTLRARIIAYHKDRVQSAELSTYEALTDPKWRGRVLIRSSSNIYNQSLLASIIAADGAPAARRWAAGLVSNMARPPTGNDRDQMKALAAGEGDVAIVNTYYVGLMLSSGNAAERSVGQLIGLFFPNQEDRGTHVNVSGAGVTASAKNIDNALRLLAFLASEEAQTVFATANFEYPVNPEVAPAALLESWGRFKADPLPLHLLGRHNSQAVRIFDQVGWR